MDTDAINMMSGFEPLLMKDRFRGFLPVVVDIETGGFNCHTDGLLEVAITLLTMNEAGELVVTETHSRNVEPFEGANLEPSALEFTGIDPENPLRGALPEAIALGELFALVRQSIKEHISALAPF